MASTACANKTVMVFGLMELLLALGIITCGVFNIVNKSRLYKIHHGLWGGGYMALTAFFAIYAGLKQARGMHIAHMIMSILGLIFIIPGTSALFAIEIVSDYYFSYWTDDNYSYCIDCYWPSSSNNNNNYNFNLNWGTTTPSYSGLLQDLKCNGYMTSQMCHPNTKAVTSCRAAIIMCSVMFIFFIISASFNCCSICACCGANRNPGAMAVYPISNGPYSTTGMNTYPSNGYPAYGWNGGQQVSYSEASYTESNPYGQPNAYGGQPSPYGQPNNYPPPQVPPAGPGQQQVIFA